MKTKSNLKTILWIVALILAVVLIFYVTDGSGKGTPIDFKGTGPEINSFEKLVENNDVEAVCINGNIVKIKLKNSKVGDNFPNKADCYFTVGWSATTAEFYEMIKGTGIRVIDQPQTESFLEQIAPYFSIVIVLLMGFFLIRSISGANSKNISFGKTRAQMAKDIKTRFSDVAGIDEEKEELQEVVEFLKNPQKFTELGAKIPKGVLLVGAPGTGKTLLAKAIAGESNVPFFSISGSDFVEMFVGVGASRVRDLFDQAKKHAPCIVFIDEIDAVGRQRGAGLGGGNDEREQTLNQLLVQMDGFEANEGIIVIAATNRSDVLDPALLRPGRFDRQVFVNPPDVKGREMILKVHARKKPIDSSVDFKNIARLTSGFTGADIENLLNEAAILAAKANRKKITMTDVTEGINKVLLGPQKRSRIITDEDKRITAYHEAGHAIVGKKCKHCDEVQEVSVIPRGMAAGYTLSRPDNDENHLSYNKLMDMLTMMLGGRVAEQLVIKDITTGAQNDIQRATQIARKMVTEWGMSDLGAVNYGSSSEVFLGRDYQTQVSYSEKTAADIDSQVRKIIDTCYQKAVKILKDNMSILDTMAQVLIEKETIYHDEVELLMKGKTKQQVIKVMERNDRKNKERLALEAAEMDLERITKEQAVRIKTAEALRNAEAFSQEEIDKIKKEAEMLINQAKEKVEELKEKYTSTEETDDEEETKPEQEEVSVNKLVKKTKVGTRSKAKKVEQTSSDATTDDNQGDKK